MKWRVIFTDLAFHGGHYFLLDAVGDRSQLLELDGMFSIIATLHYPGAPRRVFVYDEQLVVITHTAGEGLAIDVLPFQ